MSTSFFLFHHHQHYFSFGNAHCPPAVHSSDGVISPHRHLLPSPLTCRPVSAPPPSRFFSVLTLLLYCLAVLYPNLAVPSAPFVGLAHSRTDWALAWNSLRKMNRSKGFTRWALCTLVYIARTAVLASLFLPQPQLPFSSISRRATHGGLAKREHKPVASG
jgi:hypothetical protein